MASMAFQTDSSRAFQQWCDRQLLELRSHFDQYLEDQRLESFQNIDLEGIEPDPQMSQSQMSQSQMSQSQAQSQSQIFAAQLFQITKKQFSTHFSGNFSLRSIDAQSWEIHYHSPRRSTALNVLENTSEVHLTQNPDNDCDGLPTLDWDSQTFASLREDFFQQVSQCLSRQAHLMTQIRSLQQRCQKLEIEKEELQQISHLKSEFLANTSHEIRTPLSSILGFTHLLREQGFNPGSVRHQEYLRIILTSGQHLLALINDILDLSKIEANQLDLNWETIEIEPLCRLVLTLVQEKANDRGLSLISEFAPDLDCLFCDPLRLKQMLFNLLSNALKFTPQGIVGLRVTQTPDTMSFTVWDTGVGIPHHHLDRLFQPYHQLPQNPSRQAEGTGLGLSLTRKFAELHQGRIEVVSSPDHGSQFTILLPRHQVSAANTVPKRPSPNPLVSNQPSPNPPGSKAATISPLADSPTVEGMRPATPNLSSSTQPVKPPIAHIILVEDNIHNAQLIRAYLQKKGYQISWAKNHTELWKLLEKITPRIILMDIQLPEVDGLMLIQQLRETPSYATIPIIAQTALAMSGDRQACLAAGATDYMTKPLDLQTLASILRRYS